jgi:hypothetical protein
LLRYNRFRPPPHRQLGDGHIQRGIAGPHLNRGKPYLTPFLLFPAVGGSGRRIARGRFDRLQKVSKASCGRPPVGQQPENQPWGGQGNSSEHRCLGRWAVWWRWPPFRAAGEMTL